MLYLDYSRRPGEWIPNKYGGRENLEAVQLLQEVNATTAKRVPGIVMIAEESTSWAGVTAPTDQGGLGFALKWNMGWMNDTLRYLGQEPIFRQYHHNQLTFALMYQYSEHFVLPISHDEVVHGKGSLMRKVRGSREDQLATVRAYLAYMWSHPGKQLLFMGSEMCIRDSLATDPIYRQYHHNKLTFALMYAYSENFILPISHDAVSYTHLTLPTSDLV